MSVRELTNRLARAGIIRHARGCIDVLDRKRLESICCECYAVINREYARLLG